MTFLVFCVKFPDFSSVLFEFSQLENALPFFQVF